MCTAKAFINRGDSAATTPCHYSSIGLFSICPQSAFSFTMRIVMKYPISLIAMFFILGLSTAAFGQGKGVDSQGQKITDNSANKTAGVNGGKTDVGTTGSGINFGKDKTKVVPMLPNPYRLTARRDVIMKAVADVMRDRKLILDEASSKSDEGILV